MSVRTASLCRTSKSFWSTTRILCTSLPRPDIRKEEKGLPKQRAKTAQTIDPHQEEAKGGEWTVVQASTVTIARDLAGCPLETLAYWSPERKVEVLIGNLDSLPQRPQYVLFDDQWEDDW